MEASLVSLGQDDFKFRLTFVAGFGADGSHLSSTGVDVLGNDVDVPLYRHRVAVDMFTLQPQLTIAATEDWYLEFRLPLRRIVRNAKVVPVENATSAEIAEMQRNLDLHHPSATLEGMGDLFMFMRPRDLANHWSWGATLPTGKTEEDPYVLGDSNLAHEHIQLGTGALIPRIEYRRNSEEWISFATLALPFYANRHGFTAPPELGLFAARRGHWTEQWSWSLGTSARLQGYGDWNGTRDINTGYGALVADAGLVWSGSAGNLYVGLTLPIAQRVWQEDGDTFELGTTFAISFSP